MSDRVKEPGWDAGWDSHSRAQMQRMARLTLIEKLEWLEQAQRMVEEMNKSRHGEVRDAGRDDSSDVSA